MHDTSFASPAAPSPFHGHDKDAIVSAWLQDLVDAITSPPGLLSPPPSPTSTFPHKRKAGSRSSSSTAKPQNPKRQAVTGAPMMESQQDPKTPRKSRRLAVAKDIAGGGHLRDDTSSSASDNDNEDGNDAENYLGSPTPTRLQRPPAAVSTVTIPSHPHTASSAYAAAIESRAAASMANPPSLPAPSEAASKTRLRSPVRGMANLEFADKPVKVVDLVDPSQIPNDVSSLFREIKRIKAGRGVVPESLRHDVEQEIAVTTPFEPELEDRNLDTTPTVRTHNNLLYELATLGWVVRDTREALNHQRSEAHWNERVHSPILVAAVERDRNTPGLAGDLGTRVFNSTQATIAPVCIPRHAEGLNLEAKMVDYCICVSDPSVQRAAREAVTSAARDARRHSSRRPPPSSRSASVSSSMSAASSAAGSARQVKDHPLPQSVNHTEYAPLCLSPIAVSIETKKPGGSEDEARAQLSVWVSAQMVRLHQLLGPQPVGITLPLLCVTGASWEMLFAVEKADHLEILPSFRFDGATSTLLGCYQIIGLLRALREWSETVFQEWFLGAVQAA
ncbi:Putative PD-(D/E)XK nuclease [Colletotrichum destructivum]|uniref:PD-(D/E)XK nuclease n=1 Tax=Colletotrichum destructivum TaxID=34406 RepID=A0AAX4J4C9_9PEZI|nr:Putative PD-(D/E)XK nuclease [Colletotrichum destructivum]